VKKSKDCIDLWGRGGGGTQQGAQSGLIKDIRKGGLGSEGSHRMKGVRWNGKGFKRRDFPVKKGDCRVS